MQVNPWLVLALVGGLVGADQVRAEETAREATVEVVAKRSLMSATSTLAVGGGFVAGGELFAADGTTRVGDGYSHCGALTVSVAVPPEVTAQCASVYRLKEGEIYFSGIRTYKSIAAGFGDTTVGVTGGTGAYANARGEGKVTRLGGQEVGYKIVFTVTTD
ncbi:MULTISPECIES: hypothetical protein [Saccharothrix]|uniref:hypothetical protein n=1 Tax=Saccharothrix TaxID=2071 RepID=UPI0009403018|nr:hypothetical protein [Saccharothrix sp. CB00851]OKI18526.1 hypothetical protein A6A25_39925 [Saccharothrix sp. CB00851]